MKALFVPAEYRCTCGRGDSAGNGEGFGLLERWEKEYGSGSGAEERERIAAYLEGAPGS